MSSDLDISKKNKDKKWTKKHRNEHRQRPRGGLKKVVWRCSLDAAPHNLLSGEIHAPHSNPQSRATHLQTQTNSPNPFRSSIDDVYWLFPMSGWNNVYYVYYWNNVPHFLGDLCRT
ncbi:hypothetical protein MTR_4g036890 [Medicago truncatula]|uniref:Uncharacterized protein n=1 Tax=Medicago truncatula TaxID=3880 RepID=A0A072UJ60_MEDTR|nr:hypothetical protein MTR_4g036890 [Medicago truncatula]